MSKMRDNEEGKVDELSGRAHYVFVHGASHGGWCWYKIRTQLEEAGHTVTCVDLKSAGIDPANPDTLFNFSDYNQPLLSFMSSLPESQKVILVGHSLGGFNITQALFKFTNKISIAVYLAAAMAKSTDTPLSTNDPTSSKFYHPLSEITRNSLDPEWFDWGYGLGPDGPPTSAAMKKQYQRQMYYNMSPLEDSTLASMLLRPVPLLAASDYFNQPGGDESEVEKVPRVYIKTLHDNIVTSHDSIIESWPPSEVLEIDSDHSAFFSNPTHLFNLLVYIHSKYV